MFKIYIKVIRTTSTMELLAKIVSCWKLLTISAKSLFFNAVLMSLLLTFNIFQTFF